MGKHDTVMQAIELKAREMGLPFEVVSPQTFAVPKQVRINRKLWDAITLIPGQTIWVEAKVGNDTYTPSQLEFLKELLAFDIPAIKVSSAEEFQELMLECLYERHLTLADVRRARERMEARGGSHDLVPNPEAAGEQQLLQ